MRARLLFTAALAACASAPAPAASAPADTAAVLRQHTQELLEAVTAGDPKVWDRYLARDMVFLSGAGEVQPKAALLDELKPLPAGISGQLTIGRFDVKQF